MPHMIPATIVRIFAVSLVICIERINVSVINMYAVSDVFFMIL
jgi:hypothetical protein